MAQWWVVDACELVKHTWPSHTVDFNREELSSISHLPLEFANGSRLLTQRFDLFICLFGFFAPKP